MTSQSSFSVIATQKSSSSFCRQFPGKPGACTKHDVQSRMWHDEAVKQQKKEEEEEEVVEEEKEEEGEYKDYTCPKMELKLSFSSIFLFWRCSHREKNRLRINNTMMSFLASFSQPLNSNTDTPAQTNFHQTPTKLDLSSCGASSARNFTAAEIQAPNGWWTPEEALMLSAVLMKPRWRCCVNDASTQTEKFQITQRVCST